MFWIFMNFAAAMSCFSVFHMTKCTVYAAAFLSFIAIGIGQSLDLFPASELSFVFGALIYGIPIFVAVNGVYTRRKAALSLCIGSLLALEIAMLAAFTGGIYSQAYPFYEPVALTIYLLLIGYSLWVFIRARNKQHKLDATDDRHGDLRRLCYRLVDSVDL